MGINALHTRLDRLTLDDIQQIQSHLSNEFCESMWRFFQNESEYGL